MIYKLKPNIIGFKSYHFSRNEHLFPLCIQKKKNFSFTSSFLLYNFFVTWILTETKLLRTTKCRSEVAFGTPSAKLISVYMTFNGHMRDKLLGVTRGLLPPRTWDVVPTHRPHKGPTTCERRGVLMLYLIISPHEGMRFEKYHAESGS